MISVLAVLATGCAREKEQESTASEQVKVNVATVAVVSGLNEFSYSGTVEASQTIPLSFRTTGTVQEVFVDAGDEVKKGQVLATIDDADMQNIYATMLAKYNQANDAYERLKTVHEQGSLPEVKWVEMQTGLEQAKASLELARNNLDKCRLEAPVSGIVGRRNIEPGQSSVSLAGAPIELVRIEKVLIKISVPESEINRIKKGDRASVKVLAVDGAGFSGEVTNISPVAELISRTYTVKIAVDNPGMKLKPGMVCDVAMNPGKPEPVLVVPYRAVGKDSDGNNYVFAVNPDGVTVKKQIVTVGRYNGAGIVITSGLTEGQTVVTAGIEKLSDNSSIGK